MSEVVSWVGLPFFPESVWAKGSSNSGGLSIIFFFSHLLISHLHMSSSHLHIYTYHPLIFTSTHIIFSSSHLHISSSLLHIYKYHLLIFTSTHIIFSCSHLHMSFSHLLIFTSEPWSKVFHFGNPIILAYGKAYAILTFSNVLLTFLL